MKIYFTWTVLGWRYADSEDEYGPFDSYAAARDHYLASRRTKHGDQ